MILAVAEFYNTNLVFWVLQAWGREEASKILKLIS